MRRLSVLIIGLLALGTLPAANAQAPATRPTTRPAPAARFDPKRHMCVDEVRPGMKGYGLTVLSGTTITRFEVEVLSVLNDVFGPDQSVVMIRCNDEFMEHVGPIQGCSGSPIYLYDEAGNARLIGAYAYGYDLARDPIIGIQPIEYMLSLDPAKQPDAASSRASGTWSLLDSPAFAGILDPAAGRDSFPADAADTPRGEQTARPASGGGASLGRLMTPLAVRGMRQAELERFTPALRAHGFAPMVAMGGGKADAEAALEPGSVLGALLLSGDLDMAAIGTCTEVIDGRAYGFGHPFMGEGSTSVPMGAGSVDLVMPVLTSSFKLGSVARVSGAIDMDGTFGIAGQLGAKARTFPIDVMVVDESVGRTQTFHYDCAVHPLMSPMLTAAALQASLTSQKELPRDHTIDYRAELKFQGGRSLSLRGVASSTAGDNVAQSAVWPAMLLGENPFERVPLDGLRLEATIRNRVELVELQSARADASAYKPGEKVTLYVRLKPFRGEVYEKILAIDLPTDLEEGEYTLTIADAASNLQVEVQENPAAFAIRDIDELFEALEKVIEGSEGDGLFIRLSSTRAGVVIGRTAFEKLPASKRALLEAAARPDTAASIESQVKRVALDRPVSGAAAVAIRVARKLP